MVHLHRKGDASQLLRQIIPTKNTNEKKVSWQSWHKNLSADVKKNTCSIHKAKFNTSLPALQFESELAEKINILQHNSTDLMLHRKDSLVF